MRNSECIASGDYGSEESSGLLLDFCSRVRDKMLVKTGHYSVGSGHTAVVGLVEKWKFTTFKRK